jgi:hypothetical protein
LKASRIACLLTYTGLGLLPDMTQSELDVRHRAKDYVDGRSTLTDFGLWLATLSWELDETADVGLKDLVNGIELRIAEFTSGAWTEAELRDRIRVPLNASTVVLTASAEAHQKPRVEYSNRSETRSLRLAVA